jgi:predicted AlkP superfamily phosphohydrolase/phosphomutase
MAKLLIVGLDGATLDLILPWAREGILPTLAGLMRTGVWGPLRSVPNANSAPAWSSFATGLDPGKHGIFYFTDRIPGTYHRRPIHAGFRAGATFWSLLSQAGYQVGIINVPLTYPAETVNGFVVAGLDTPGTDSPGFTYPEKLARQIRRQVGEYIIEPGIPGMIKAGRKLAALERILLTIEQRLKCARWLYQYYQPELLAVVFTATDAVQHFFWGDMDRAYPFHNPMEAERFGDAIKQVYVRLDQALDELIAVAQPEMVMVVSDHGFGFNQRGAEYLRPWLAELGMLKWRTSGSSKRKLVGAIYHSIDRLLDRETKLRLARWLPGLRARVETAIQTGDIDWPATRVYCTATTDDLYINLCGREPEGIVTPGTEYQELCAFLVELLQETTDPVTGRPAVEFVARREEVYRGPYVGRAPDILIRWSTQSVLSGLHTPGYNPVPAEPFPPPLQTGGHRLYGVLIASGGPFQQGVHLQEFSIMDIAPTALHLFGVPVPRDMDGQVMTPALEPSWLAAYPVRLDEDNRAQHPKISQMDYTEGEIADIEERLRGMGYIE